MEEVEESVSIKLGELWRLLINNRWKLFIISLLFGSLGAIYAFTAREEFVSEGIILPEFQSKTGGLSQFAGLASLAGIDLASVAGGAGAAVDAVRPDLYPDVIKSTPFFMDLLKLKVKNKNNKEMVFSDFYFQEVLDGEVKEENLKLKYPTNPQYIAFNYQTEKNLKDLRKRVVGSLDKKTGEITITVKMPDPVVAALVTKFSMDYLTTYVINYRIEKAMRDLQFIESRLSAARGKYYTNQEKKAQYSDQFQLSTIKLQSADIQRERIDADYKISSTVYNSFLQKYEEAKLKVQQETPVLKILEPPVVPNKRKEPQRVIITIVSTIGGLFIGMFFVLFYKQNYRKVWVTT
jgi:uncharacterized protein involved in exopolysaccharide biosynthesis